MVYLAACLTELRIWAGLYRQEREAGSVVVVYKVVNDLSEFRRALLTELKMWAVIKDDRTFLSRKTPSQDINSGV